MPSSGKLVWVQEGKGVKKTLCQTFPATFETKSVFSLNWKKTVPRRQKELNRTLDFPESGRTAAMLV